MIYLFPYRKYECPVCSKNMVNVHNMVHNHHDTHPCTHACTHHNMHHNALGTLHGTMAGMTAALDAAPCAALPTMLPTIRGSHAHAHATCDVGSNKMNNTPTNNTLLTEKGKLHKWHTFMHHVMHTLTMILIHILYLNFEQAGVQEKRR